MEMFACQLQRPVRFSIIPKLWWSWMPIYVSGSIDQPVASRPAPVYLLANTNTLAASHKLDKRMASLSALNQTERHPALVF
jgi:hypothetical protein